MRRGMGALVVAAAVLLVPVMASAQSPGAVSGLLVRVQGDVVVDADESADLIVVVSGDAEVRGRAGAVVVIGGTARLLDARVGRVAVVRGTADLGGTTVVSGDVWLLGAQLERAAGARIGGSVQQGFGNLGWRGLAQEPLLAVGLLALVLLLGWLAVAVGAGAMRRAGEALTGDLVGSFTAALLLFVVAPVAAVLLFFTVVGVPLSFAYLVVVLPALGVVGFLVSALVLGGWLLRSRASALGAVLLGSVALAAAGLIPFVGQVVVVLACALGGGALAVTASRAGRREGGAEPGEAGP